MQVTILAILTLQVSSVLARPSLPSVIPRLLHYQIHQGTGGMRSANYGHRVSEDGNGYRSIGDVELCASQGRENPSLCPEKSFRVSSSGGALPRVVCEVAE